MWLSTEAIIPVLAKGVPLDRIMRMRWVLTWKDPPEEAPDDPKKAKARLVVLGYTDPDLVDVPGDSPTLSSKARQILYAICAANCWKLCKGDIKTAFLQGEKSEAA